MEKIIMLVVLLYTTVHLHSQDIVNKADTATAVSDEELYDYTYYNIETDETTDRIDSFQSHYLNSYYMDELQEVDTFKYNITFHEIDNLLVFDSYINGKQDFQFLRFIISECFGNYCTKYFANEKGDDVIIIYDVNKAGITYIESIKISGPSLTGTTLIYSKNRHY
jgi:hypothetical protein